MDNSVITLVLFKTCMTFLFSAILKNNSFHCMDKIKGGENMNFLLNYPFKIHLIKTIITYQSTTFITQGRVWCHLSLTIGGDAGRQIEK